MATAVKYLSNVTKSVKYAAIDVLKELNPVIVDAVETNADVAKVTYSSIKNFKQTTARAMKSLSESQVGELAKEAKKNIVEDIKSGKFYNRERMIRVENEMAAREVSDDISEFMVDEGADDLGFDTDTNEFLADTMDNVGEKTSNAINQVLAKTAEYQVEATRQSTTRILAQTSAMTATLHGDLSAVNANIAGVVQFNQEVMSTHVENSRLFFERQQEQMSEQISLLTEIRDIQRSVFSPKRKSISSKVTVSDIFSSNGMINLAEYFKYVQQNIADQDSGMSDWIKAASGMGIGKMMVANPIGEVMKGVIKTAIPKIVKDAMEEFNESLSGSISTALLNLTKGKDSSNGLMAMLGNIFGLDLSVKNSINTGDYEKGTVPWTGKDHKALTEVIPTLLSKIYSSVSGNPEIRYDYNAGRFKNYNQIQKDFRKDRDRYVKSANESILPYIQEELNKIDFGGNTRRQQELIDNLEKILKYNFDKMEKFNPRDKSLTAKSYGLKGDHAEYDLQLIRSIFEKIPKSKQLKNQNDLIESIQSWNNFITTAQKSGDSIYNVLFDDSIKGKSKKNKSKLDTVGFNKIDTTNSILTEIRDYLLSGKKIRYESKTVKTSEKIKEENIKKSDKLKSDLGFTLNSTGKKSMSIDEDINLDIPKSEQSKFIKDLQKAETATQKLKILFKSGSLILTKPAEFSAAILRKVDNRLYNLLFSKDEDDTSSIMGKIRDGFDDWFENLKELTKQRFDDIKDAIGESGIKNKFSSVMKTLFGFDFEKWEDEFKDALFGDKDTSLVSGMRDLLSKGFREMFDGVRKLFKTETEEQELKRKDNRAAKDLGKILDSMGYGKTQSGDNNAAKGTRRVSKTGLIAVSEGEMIIPPDLNPYNIKERTKKEEEAIRKYEAVFGSSGIEGFAEGGEVGKNGKKVYRGKKNLKKFEIEAFNFLKEKIQEGWSSSQIEEWLDDNVPDKESRRRIFEKTVSQNKAYAKQRTKNMTKRVIDFGYAMGEEAKNLGNVAMENDVVSDMVGKVTSIFNKKVPAGGKDIVTDISKNFTDYLPRIAAGGVTGMGLSLLLGLAGGPIVGAAVGAGLGILSKSEKLQTWLFGKEATDKYGNKYRDGSGLISKDLVQNIDKYFPNMTKGAIVGGITSILPFVPGGPLAGIMVGSAVGFAKSNEKLNSILFGENGKLSKAIDIVKQKLPKMGLGASIGLLTGPFGLTTNLIVGAGLGFVSDTEKFKEIVFGVKGFDGKRAGGLVGFIRDAAEIPIQGLRKLYNETTSWFKSDILDPIRKGLNPFLQQIKNIGLWIKDGIEKIFRDHIARPIGAKIMDKIIKPFENVAGKIIHTILTPIKVVASTPFKLFGLAGQALERRQLRRTGAASGTASERIRKREALDSNRKNKKFINTEANIVDSIAATATNEELEEYQMLNEVSQSVGKLGGGKRARERAIKRYSKGLVSRSGLDKLLLSHVNRNPRQLSEEDYKFIMNEVVDGQYKGSVSLIMSSGAFPDEYKKEACKKIKDTAIQINDARKKARNFKEEARRIKDRTGVDISTKGFGRVITKEMNDRGLYETSKNVEASTEENAIPDIMKDNHTQVMDVLNKIADAIEVMAYPNKKKEYKRKLKAQAKADKRAKQDKDAIQRDFEEREPSEYDEDYYIPNFVMVDDENSKSNNAGNFRKHKSKGIWDKLVNAFEKALNRSKENINISPTDIVAVAQAGDYSLANNLANGRITSLARLKTNARSLISKLRKKSGKSKTVMTDNGPILTRIDAQGNEIPDERDSETKETLAIRDEQRETQKGILAKISSLGDGLNLLGFPKEDEEEEGFFSKIISKVAKYALPTLIGLGGIGVLSKVAGKKIQVQQKDSQGNKMYDENGNPIMVETTVGDAIKDKVSEVWLGPDGTGNTSGVWYHVKDFTRNNILPAIGTGIDAILTILPSVIQTGVQTITEYAPKLIELLISGLIEHAPKIVWGGIKGLAGGIGKVMANIFGGEDEKQKASEIEEEEFRLAGSANSTNNTSSNKNTPQTQGAKIVSAMQKAFDSSSAVSVSAPTTTGVSTSTTNIPNASLSTIKTSGASKTTTTSGTTATGNAKGTTSSKDVSSAKALDNTNEYTAKKATSQLESIWNNQTQWGVTVGELLDSDDIIVAYTTNSDGSETPVYGSDLLNHPEIAKSALGIDIGLTDEERDENTDETHPYLNRGVKGVASKASNAAFRIAATGGRAGAGLKALSSATTKLFGGAGDALLKYGSKGGVTRRTIGTLGGLGVKAAGYITAAPAYAGNIFRDAVKSYNSGSTAKQAVKDAFSNVVYDAKTASAKRAARQAKKANKPKNIFERLSRTKDNIKNAGAKVTGFGKKVANAGKNAFGTAQNIYSDIQSGGFKKAGKNMYDSAVNKANQFADNLWESDYAENVVERFSGDILDADGNVISNVADTTASTTKSITSKADDVVETVTDISTDVKGLQKNTSTALSTITENASNKATGKTGGKISGKIQDLIEKFGKILSEFLSDSTVVNKLKEVVQSGSAKKKIAEEAIEKALKNFAETLTEKFTKGLLGASAKIIAKISTKLATYIGSGGIVTVAFAIADFLMGMKNADAIMQAVDPTLGERFISGLVNVICNTFFVGLVLDTQTVISLGISLLEALGVNFDDLRKRQEEAEELTAQYNREHGTNLSPYEYLMEGKIETKVKKAVTKVWNSRPLSLARGQVEGVISIAKGAGKGAWSVLKGVGGGLYDTGKGIVTGIGKTLTGHPIEGLKSIGGGIASGAKKIGSGVVNGVKEVASGVVGGVKKYGQGVKEFFFGKDKEEEAETTEQATTESTTAMVTQAEEAATNNQLIYDDAGNVIGAGVNEDGTVESMFIPQGDATTGEDLTDQANVAGVSQEGTISQTYNSNSMISDQNMSNIQEAKGQINTLIPNMIKALKNKLAAFFGLNPSELDKIANVGASIYKDSSPTIFFNSISNMWKQASTKLGGLDKALPKAIGSAVKNVSHFLAVAFGLADPEEKNISIEDATNETYLDRRAKVISETSAFSATLGAASVTGSNSADPNTQANSLDSKKTTTTSSSSSLLSKVGSFISKVFGFGGGSGSGLSGEVDGLPDEDRSKVETFISQKYSRYANSVFTVKGDSKRQTVSDAGCAPAAATMAINNLGTVQPLDMRTAIKHAIAYKKPNGGVTADYFIDEFNKMGLQAAYVAGNANNKEEIILNQLKQGNPIILMGQDQSNSTKKISPFGPKTHYVVATGLSPDGRTVYVNDPEAKNPRVPYSLRRLMKGTILGVAPVAKSKSRSLTSAADKKAKKLLGKFGGSGKYGADTVQYKVWNGLRAGGYNEFTVAATMGNIEMECGFNPDLIEKGSGIGYGLVQWSYGRRTAYEKYAKSKGKDRSDLQTQIEYLLKELAADSGIWTKGSSKYGFGTLTRDDWANAASTNDIEKATKAFMCCFERPSYNPSTNHIDKRITAAKKYYEEFTGTPVSGSSGSTEDGSTTESNNPLTSLLDAFTRLGSAYGLNDNGTTSGSNDSGTYSSGGDGEIDADIHGNVSSNPEYAAKQKQLVNMMKKYEGQIQYSQGPSSSKYYGPTRDPEQVIDGKRYGDCSSTVQWVYKKVLGVDPGSYTGAQETDSDTYSVGNGTSDESKLQLGDLLLKNGHVEMYYGDKRMIGHGGGANGKTPGPTIKTLGENPPYKLARRWVGFKGGSGSGLSTNIPISSNTTIKSKNNSLYSKQWSGSGSGITSSIASSSEGYGIATTQASTTRESRIVPTTYSDNGMDKLIQIIIGLLGQVVNNTAAIKDISSLLIKLIDLKSTYSDSGLSDKEKEAIGNEMGMMKALIAQAFNNQSKSTDDNLSRLIQNVEAIAMQ